MSEATKASTQLATQTPAPVAGGEQAYTPDVDIWEATDAVHLSVNLPGVSRDAVELTTENDTLTVTATVGLEAPAGYRLEAQEFPMGQYRRTFDLSRQVSTENIAARMKDGVLRVTLPTAAAARNRRIDIAS